MAMMREGMARMLSGETPPPAAATLIGMAPPASPTARPSWTSPSTTVG